MEEPLSHTPPPPPPPEDAPTTTQHAPSAHTQETKTVKEEVQEAVQAHVLAQAHAPEAVKKAAEREVGFGQAAADEISKYLPASISVYVKKSGPYVDKVGYYINIIFPVLVLYWNKLVVLYGIIEKYHPEEYFPMALGLVMAFFGGHFVALIAAIEAFKMCGWDTTKRCLVLLYNDYKNIKAANDKDNLVDDNNDGIADVLQISSRELATRKIKVVIKACDPDTISEALFGLNTAVLAVIATLRAQFAFTITLGASIGTIMSRVVFSVAFPVLRQVVPLDYQKWISPLIKYSCRGFGITIAWWLQMISSSIHSALRGGEQFTKGLVLFLARNNYAFTVTEGSHLFAIIMYSVALLGFYCQVATGFSLIFPLNIILFPFTTMEWLVRYIISY